MSIFVNYTGVEGQATDQGHEDWMRVDSLEWGIKRGIKTDTGVSGDREAGTVTVSDLKLVRRADKASPKLVMEACLGDGQDVEIHITRNGKGDGSITYIKYTLKNALVSEYNVNVDDKGEDQIPKEHITIAFVEFTVEYTQYDDDGNPVSTEMVGFNTAKNTKV